MAKRILIVGAGGIGLKHLRAFSALDPKPHLAVIDPRPEARARAVDEFGVEALDADWDSLDLSAFDGVVICAPAPKHVPFSIRCLREGIPVLSEKPLSHSWEGVEELLGLAEQSNTPSGVAYVRRYHPAHEQAQRLLTSGELGEILEVRVVGGQPFTTYRPDYRQIYYASREQGGGCLLDCASHFIDLVQWYMGPVGSMCGHIRHLALEGVEVEDVVSLSLDFRSGSMGSVHINQYQPLNETCIEFAGVDSVLRIVEPGFACRIWRKGAENWEGLEVQPGDYAEALRRQAEAFVSTIDGGPPMRTSFADAARTLRACLDVLESAGM